MAPGVPAGWNGAGGTRGVKKPGTPNSITMAAPAAFSQKRSGPSLNHLSAGQSELTKRQNSSNRDTRLPGGLPAISAALMAPIEMPATHSGSISASCSASKTPAW
jgi:hypothetical protein